MNINWDELREEEFPSLKNVVYLKAAGGSPISTSAYQSGVKYFNEMLNYGDIFWDQYFNELNSVRKKVAYYINSKPSEIAFLMNTSSCMNVVARLLKNGDIIYPEGEFPSSIHIFKKLGFNCKKLSESNFQYPIRDLKKIINKRIKIIIHSHIQYLTGFKQDLKLLGELCKQHELINIINATQSFGAFPIDVKNSNINILVASALKWACCGYGIGILFVSEKILEECDLPFSSWLSVKDAFSMDNDNINVIKQTKFMDSLGGTPHFPALFTLIGGLNLLERIGDGDLRSGVIRISNRILGLTSEFIAKIKELNYKIITPIEKKNRSGIITLEHDKAETIFNGLLKNGIYISLRNYPKSTKKTLLRFSFNFYNNLADIEKCVSILSLY